MNTSLRLFFAIQLSDEMRSTLAQQCKSWRTLPWAKHIRWIPAENFHLTLRFIGEFPIAQIELLTQQVQQAINNAPDFTLEFDKIAIFPSRHKPRVLIVDIKNNSALSQLAQAIEDGVQKAGLAAETRPFRPHLSLGRFTRRPTVSTENLPPCKLTSLWVEKIALMSSEEQNRKRVYQAIQIIPLPTSDTTQK